MRTTSGGERKERISITLDRRVLEYIRERSVEDDRTLSQYINRTLRKAMMEEKGKPED